MIRNVSHSTKKGEALSIAKRSKAYYQVFWLLLFFGVNRIYEKALYKY